MEESASCDEGLEVGGPGDASPEAVVHAAAAAQLAVERYRDRAWSTGPTRSLGEIQVQAQGLRDALVQMLSREPSIEEVAEALRMEAEAARVESADHAVSAPMA
ncbi:hypothetical protein [Sinomonas sp.]|uniref:hypothetical protein n=1 Tax=Sinomonas sp. TaxID=1914986 RepID=UPI002FE3D308